LRTKNGSVFRTGRMESVVEFVSSFDKGNRAIKT
jgi:hypothetical protein